MADTEPADLKRLRQLLKLDGRTKPSTLAAAAALARDSSQDSAEVLNLHGVPPGSHGRAKMLAGRIITESLLDDTGSETSGATVQWLPADALLLSSTWIATNAPGLIEVMTDKAVLSTDGKHATRVVRARLSGCDEIQVDEIEYDVVLGEQETEKSRSEKHRMREKACIRRLDSAAADAHRMKKAAGQRERRANDASVRSVVDGMISRLERRHERELVERQEAANGPSRVWFCPAGCVEPGSCARAAFRMQCLPTMDDVASCLEKRWQCNHGILTFGELVGPSGHTYGAEMQLQMLELQEQELAASGLQFSQESIAFSEVREIQDDFLNWWDGRAEPCSWLHSWVESGHNQLGSAEYLGPERLKRSDRDQFGPDHRPAGRIACARRGCTGCCFCHGTGSLPIFLQVRSLAPPGKLLFGAANGWVTLDELRQEVDKLSKCQLFRPEPLPVYLLERSAFETRRDGRVICLPGKVRDYVAASEIAAWQAQLVLCHILLLTLQNDSFECQPDAAERLTIETYLSRQSQEMQEAAARWEATRKETAELNYEVTFAAQRGCGLRVRHSLFPPALTRGDLVYPPLPLDAAHPPGTNQHVGIVTDVLKSCGNGGGNVVTRTGLVNVLFWNLGKQAFCSQVERNMPEVQLSLFPPCCGRGAGCPYLQEKEEWPNGDELNMQHVEGIPAAFQKLLQARYTPRALRELPLLKFGQLFAQLPQPVQPQDSTVSQLATKGKRRKRQRATASDGHSCASSVSTTWYVGAFGLRSGSPPEKSKAGQADTAKEASCHNEIVSDGESGSDVSIYW